MGGRRISSRAPRWIAGSIVVGAIAVLIARPFDAGNAGERSERLLLSESELLARADSLSHAAYWVGPRPGAATYELVLRSDQVYVRYLPAGVRAGVPRAEFLVIGAFPKQDAERSVERERSRGGKSTKLFRLDGMTALSTDYGRHVTVAVDRFPNLEIVLYSPRLHLAEELVMDDALRPIG